MDNIDKNKAQTDQTVDPAIIQPKSEKEKSKFFSISISRGTYMFYAVLFAFFMFVSLASYFGVGNLNANGLTDHDQKVAAISTIFFMALTAFCMYRISRINKANKAQL